MTTLLRKGRLLRIPIKLSLALVAGGFVIFGAHGVYKLHAERNAIRAVIEEETWLLGQSVQMAVENALRDRQLAARILGIDRRTLYHKLGASEATED